MLMTIGKYLTVISYLASSTLTFWICAGIGLFLPYVYVHKREQRLYYNDTEPLIENPAKFFKTLGKIILIVAIVISLVFTIGAIIVALAAHKPFF